MEPEGADPVGMEEEEDDVDAVVRLNIPGTAAMRANDALLNNGIEEEVTKFLNGGGTPAQAFHVLSASYEGAPDMIKALVDWTELFKSDDQGEILPAAIESVLKDNEATIVSTLDKAMAREPKTPDFLSDLNAQPYWRNVVHDLARRNKSSAMFNIMARRSRLEDIGVDQRVMDTPDKFLDAISNEVRTLCMKPLVTDTHLKQFYQNLKHVCTFDESGAVVASRLLANLSLDSRDMNTRNILRRAAQEMRLEAVKTMQNEMGVSRPVAVQFMERVSLLSDCAAEKQPVTKELLCAVAGILFREKVQGRKIDAETNLLFETFKGILGEPTQAAGDAMVDDVQAIARFGEEEAAKRVVLIKMLCQWEIYNGLVTGIFRKDKRRYVPNTNDVDIRRRNCLCMLLSYAGTYLSHEPSQFLEKLQNAEALQELRDTTKKLRTGLEKVAGVVEALVPGCPRYLFKGKPVATLLEEVENPVIAGGVLAWAREGLKGARDARVLLVTSPKYLAYLECVADKHVALRKEVLEILHDGFMAPHDLGVLDGEKLKDMYVKSMVSMVPYFMGSHVVERFLTFYADNDIVDKAHLRNFVKGLLQLVQPPYTQPFARMVLKLLNHPRMREAVNAETETGNLVIAFRHDARKMDLDSSAAVPNQA